jgi:DNA polymerase-1
MRQRGIRVDREWTREILADTEAEFSEAASWIEENIGCKPRSPKRGDWLIDRGVKFTKVTASGLPELTMPSASSPGTLPNLYERYKHDPEIEPALKAMITIGTHANLLQNLRIILAQSANDGRVHPEIRTQGAHTGRMSIIKPAMQTFKKRDNDAIALDEGTYSRLRGCFLADDGTLLVGADYASQEVRIAAAYSQDPTLLRVVFEDLNQHLETAKMIFGVSDKTTVRNPITGQTYYDCCKTLDFAQQFGAMPRRIAGQLDISLDDATKLWESWREAYAGFVAWFDAIASANAVINPWGRVIPSDPWRGYANANYAIQSTGRDVLGDAMMRLADAGWADCFWLPVHDELVLQVPEDQAERAADEMTILMSTKLRNVELPAKGEIIGKRWGSAE